MDFPMNSLLMDKSVCSMDLWNSIQKQSDVSLILAKHLFFSNFKEEDESSKNANMVFSPLSIQLVLGLIAAGSNGATLYQFLTFLKLNSIEEVNSLYSWIVSNSLVDGSPMGGPRLSVANGAWIDQSLSFKHSFKQIMDNVYMAASNSVDFQNKAEEVRNEVNKWAKEETNGLIKEILPQNSVKSDTVLILANALYFKGIWNEKLNDSDTKDDEFHLLNGGSVQAPFMTSRKWQYVKAFNGFKVLKRPYKQGDDKRRLSMYIYLPNARDGLPALLEKISSEPGFLNRHIPLEKVRVRKFLIPKFKITFGFEASNLLKEVGLTHPFYGDGLAEIVDANDPLFVTKVFHKSFIEVNEEGTEAAAVTAATMTMGCSMMIIKEEPIDFVADHPFLFLVKDDATGVVLFIGTVLNPLAV